MLVPAERSQGPATCTLMLWLNAIRLCGSGVDGDEVKWRVILMHSTDCEVLAGSSFEKSELSLPGTCSLAHTQDEKPVARYPQ